MNGSSFEEKMSQPSDVVSSCRRRPTSAHAGTLVASLPSYASPLSACGERFLADRLAYEQSKDQFTPRQAGRNRRATAGIADCIFSIGDGKDSSDFECPIIYFVLPWRTLRLGGFSPLRAPGERQWEL